MKEFGAAMCPCYFHILDFCMMHISKITVSSKRPFHEFVLALYLQILTREYNNPPPQKQQWKIG